MLIQLPVIGQWVNPASVIVVAAKITGETGVDVEVDGGAYFIQTADKGSAVSLRDQIAEQVNKALYEEGKC